MYDIKYDEKDSRKAVKDAIKWIREKKAKMKAYNDANNIRKLANNGLLRDGGRLYDDDLKRNSIDEIGRE